MNKIDYNDPVMKTQIRVTQEQNQSFITGIKDKSVIGYKYFSFIDPDLMTIEIRGTFAGTILVAFDEKGRNVIGEFEVQLRSKDEWETQLIPISPSNGTHPLYFLFEGTGEMDLKGFSFISA